MLIDTHTHVYPEKIAAKAAENLGNFYEFTVQESGTLQTLMDCCAAAGIGGFVLLSVVTNPAHTDRVNETAAENVKIARAAGFAAYGFGGIHQDCEDVSAALAKVKELGLCGVKIHPDIQGVNLDDERMYPIYAELEKLGLRLWLHMGDGRPQFNFSTPSRLAKVLERFPRLQTVGAHLGGYNEWDKAKDLLYRKFPNLWYDLSQCHQYMAPAEVRELIEACGPDRVFFGSDYPAVSPKNSLAAFNRMGFDAETYEKIASENLFAFLGMSQ